MIAFLFIGQGVDPPWVDADVLAVPEVASLLALASEHAGTDIARLLARGGRDLERSEIVQPAMVAVCLGVARLLARGGLAPDGLARDGLAPDVVLGHSLGEITAWAAAGGISHEDAVVLAARRGALMGREAARHPGGLLRLKGDRALVDRALADCAPLGWLCVAAHNGPDEWVVAGDRAALAHAAARFPSAQFGVAGPWHSPAMAGALGELSALLSAIPRHPMRARFIANRDGAFADDARIPELLAGQLVHPVEWVASLATLAAAGARRFLAVGPGKTLRALVHRNLGLDREVEMVDSLRAVELACARPRG